MLAAAVCPLVLSDAAAAMSCPALFISSMKVFVSISYDNDRL